MRLIFVRHGEPDYANDCLTENGKKQAINVAMRLKDEDISAIFSSPMGRARETASYTAKSHRLEIQNLDFMHEIDWGNKEENIEKVPYNGHPWTLAYELLTEKPEYVGSSDWDKHHYFKDNICLDYYQKVSRGFDAFLEQFGLFRKNGIYECKENNDKNIALFAHGGSGSIMFSHVLSLPFPFVLTSMPYGVCSISIIDFTAQNGEMIIPRLELFNDMDHIESYKRETLHFEK